MSVLTINGHRHLTQVSADYLELVAKAPLRPLNSAAEYQRALTIVDRLAVQPKLSRGQQDYLDAMAVFIEAYEDAESNPVQGVSPLEMIKSLMEHRGMTISDLGHVLGSKSAASEILHGKRGISKSHMTKLAAHFRVDAGVFLQSLSAGILAEVEGSCQGWG